MSKNTTHKKDPSAFSVRLIRRLCKPELAEEIEGNLYEYHHELYESSAAFRSVKYWYQLINYLRPSTLRTFSSKNSGRMFIFNPKVTIRNLMRYRSATLINISGFTLGLVATIFLYFYISGEVDYDSFHENGDDIYRVLRVSERHGTPYHIGVTAGPYAPAMENDFSSDITSTVRVSLQNGLVTSGNRKFFEDHLLFADANFFEFFSFPLVKGEAGSVLDKPNSVVISEEMAQKYFGDKNPVGEILEVDNEYKFMVTGIMGELPAKSHLEFDMVFSLSLFERFDWFKSWWSNGLVTYVQIPDAATRAHVEEQFPQFMEKYLGNDFRRNDAQIRLTLEPLDEVYFNNETRFDVVKHGSFKTVSTLGIVALAILAIACFNYVNLSISQSFKRAKEVGVRKILGGERPRLILQFLGESLVILVCSVTLAVGLSEILLPVLNRYFELEVTINWMDTNVLLFFLGLILLVLMASGIYPAMLLSSFRPVSVLKSGNIAAGKNLFVRKSLVITQFAISIFMIAATILISSQIAYINSKELGFSKEAVLLINMDNQAIRDNREIFKEQLLLRNDVTKVTSLSGEPGGFHDATVFRISGLDGNRRMRTVFTDPQYLNVFDIQVVEGRNFSEKFETDEHSAMVINQKALDELGLSAEEAIGKRVTVPFWDNMERTIVGVVDDFHFTSLKDKIEPLAVIMGGSHRRIAIKTDTDNIEETLLGIEETYQKFSPEFPMNYEFLDSSLQSLYENEQKQAKVFTAFSGISIFLACLGIFGLAAYSAQQRQKELGIRKVLGAAPFQILGLISKEFIMLVAIAALIATPLAWWFVQDWLRSFAYRIELANYWPVFVLSGAAAILVALVTIGFKTYRAAVSNPTESIRTE